MYKVKPEDVIPTRTQDEAIMLNDKVNGMVGGTKKSAKKAHKLMAQFNALTGNMTRDKLIDVVSLAHKIADLANEKTKKYAVCSKGCSYCCQVNVDITDYEAAYIAVKTGRMIKETPYHLKHTSKLIKYCPFHDAETSLCTIWEYRPLACRGFFAFDDPKFCVGNDQTHKIVTSWAVPAIDNLYLTIEKCGGGITNDIRYYFPYLK